MVKERASSDAIMRMIARERFPVKIYNQ